MRATSARCSLPLISRKLPPATTTWPTVVNALTAPSMSGAKAVGRPVCTFSANRFRRVTPPADWNEPPIDRRPLRTARSAALWSRRSDQPRGWPVALSKVRTRGLKPSLNSVTATATIPSAAASAEIDASEIRVVR